MLTLQKNTKQAGNVGLVPCIPDFFLIFWFIGGDTDFDFWSLQFPIILFPLTIISLDQSLFISFNNPIKTNTHTTPVYVLNFSFFYNSKRFVSFTNTMFNIPFLYCSSEIIKIFRKCKANVWNMRRRKHIICTRNSQQTRW